MEGRVDLQCVCAPETVHIPISQLPMMTLTADPYDFSDVLVDGNRYWGVVLRGVVFLLKNANAPGTWFSVHRKTPEILLL